MSTDRLPPQDIDTETACLASVLLSRDALYKVIEIIRPDDFYLEKHRIIFSAVLDLDAKNIPIDLTTLKQRLSDHNLFEKIGGDSALVSIYQSVSTSAHAASYAKRIKELSIRRNLIDVSVGSIEKCHDHARDTFELVDEIERDVFAVTEGRITSSYVPLDNILEATMAEIQRWHDTKRTVTGTPTGFADLDGLLTGLHNAELIVLAARPGMGKTALAVNMMKNIIEQEPQKAVLFFSLEMPSRQLAIRLLSIQASVDSQYIRTGKISRNNLVELYAAKEALSKKKIFIDDTPYVNIMEIRAKARKLAQKMPISVIIIDYLQLVASMSPRLDRHLQVGEISRFLKQLARELNVPVVALAQLSRAVEQRKEQRPTLADLRESGAIEQDADVVIFIYDENKVKSAPDPEKEGLVELMIAKQRNGPIGKITLKFFPQYQRFDDYYPGNESYESASPI